MFNDQTNNVYVHIIATLDVTKKKKLQPW